MSDNNFFKFCLGGHTASKKINLGESFKVFTEDCFSGELTSENGKPREVAPFHSHRSIHLRVLFILKVLRKGILLQFI